MSNQELLTFLFNAIALGFLAIATMDFGTVEQSPSDNGYEFGRWTAERLATYLTQTTGIELSSSQVRRILKRKKYSYIWAKYDLGDKLDSIERALFQQRLSDYLTIARDYPELLQVWFWDESGFSLRVIRPLKLG